MGEGEREQPSRKENDMAQGKGGTFFFCIGETDQVWST